MSKVKDLTGMKFGRWTVIERAGSTNQGRALWLCECECGTVKRINGSILLRGETNSCGCWKKERMKKLWKDEEYKKTHSNIMKKLNEEQWQDDEFRQKQRELKKQRVGNKNPNYKGGISTISQHLRNLPILTQWKKDTYIRENSKCQLTGKYVHGGNSDVHHLYGFNMIVKEAHDLYSIEIKEIVADYTEEELKLLEEYVSSYHEDTTNAVLLSKEVHDLFHHEYGQGDNTPEQFEEFKERYMAGEFNKELDSKIEDVA